MKNNNVIKIIHLVLLSITLGLSIISISNIPNSPSFIGDNAVLTLEYLADVCALLAGFIYFAGLYKKDAAKYYRIFLIFMIISLVLRLSNDNSNGLHLYLNLISTIDLIILGVGQNLGMKTTYGLGIAIIAIQIFMFFMNIINVQTITVTSLSRDISSILLSTSLMFMILGKYEDKQTRGTI